MLTVDVILETKTETYRLTVGEIGGIPSEADVIRAAQETAIEDGYEEDDLRRAKYVIR